MPCERGQPQGIAPTVNDDIDGLSTNKSGLSFCDTQTNLYNLFMKLLETVALKIDLPKDELVAGQVGTVVEELASDAYLVEFSDDEGRTYAMLPLNEAQLLALKYAKVA